jgi:hypothetical protein
MVRGALIEMGESRVFLFSVAGFEVVRGAGGGPNVNDLRQGVE